MPESLDAEKLVLGACLRDRNVCADVIELLGVEDFTIETHKRIFLAIAELAERGDGVDRVMVYNALQSAKHLPEDGLSYLVSLDRDMPNVPQIKGYIKILQEKTRLRKIILLGHDAVSAAESGSEESDRILKRLDEQIYTSFRRTETSYVTRISEYMDSKQPMEILDPKRTQGIGLPTGFSRLDELTDGFHEAEVWVCGAATGVGKTTFALQVAEHLAERGVPVLFFSMEMPKSAILGRLMCRKAEVAVMRWRSGELSQKERLRFMEAAAYVRELPIYIDETAALKASDVYLRTRRAKEQHGVQLAIVDFLQKMRSSNSRMTRNDQITEICERIQETAKEMVPFLLLSQLSREHKKLKRKPQLDDLRESGAIEQVANVCVLPYRAELENKNDASLRGKAEFILAKNRDGETMNIPMKYTGWRMRFEDISNVAGGDYE